MDDGDAPSGWITRCHPVGEKHADRAFMDIGMWLRNAVLRCEYAEDLDALEHFIYHPRLNGCSNVCLCCEHATGMCEWSEVHQDSWPDHNDGHHPSCVYAAARRELNPRRGELDAWVDEQ